MKKNKINLKKKNMKYDRNYLLRSPTFVRFLLYKNSSDPSAPPPREKIRFSAKTYVTNV